jgi:hypothetical protein
LRSRDDVARTIERRMCPDAMWYLPFGQYRRLAPMRAAYTRKRRGWKS